MPCFLGDLILGVPAAFLARGSPGQSLQRQDLYKGTDGETPESLYKGTDGETPESLYKGIDGETPESLYKGTDGETPESLYKGIVPRRPI